MLLLLPMRYVSRSGGGAWASGRAAFNHSSHRTLCSDACLVLAGTPFPQLADHQTLTAPCPTDAAGGGHSKACHRGDVGGVALRARTSQPWRLTNPLRMSPPVVPKLREAPNLWIDRVRSVAQIGIARSRRVLIWLGLTIC